MKIFIRDKKLPLSVSIITFNEVDRWRLPLTSVIDWADEVVVVDSGSADGTKELALSFGVNWLENPWPDYDQQKRFAERKCRND